MKTSMEGSPILLFCTTFLFTLVICNAVDTLTTTRSIKDGESIVSAGGSFELGFFKPGNSTKRYLGIWLKKISNGTVVWVANREIPLVDSSGVLKVTDRGILVLRNHNKTIIWSSKSSRLVKNPVAQLLESGNLVMKDGNDDNPENFLWQSFDYPSDTLLGGMKLGRNKVTGLDRYLSSWKSNDDPSPGNFTCQLDPNGYPQIFIRQGSVDLFRSGPWNGLRFSGRPDMKPSPYINFTFDLTQKEMYFIYENYNSSVVTRMVLNQNGTLDRFIWFYQANSWFHQILPLSKCDNYALCGWYGTCKASTSSEYCECLEGFMPKFPKDWAQANWSNGCVRRRPLDCRSGDIFQQHFSIKLPDTRYSWFNESMTLEECRIECLKNCTCMAYANLDIREKGSGCLLWFGDLIDIRVYTEDGQDIYIRMASSEPTDTITMSRSIRDGQTNNIVSARGSFELGFFSPGNSVKRYLGIWYKKISNRTVVWVANREIPLVDSSGVLNVTNQGILTLLNGNGTIIWSTNSSRSAINPVGQLLESGNLVVRDGNDDNPENFLWQSFDYPGDTQLPGMKLGSDTITGLERHLSSWKSTDDPSQGDYTSLIDPRGFPQLVVRKGLVLTFRAGPWNGLRFSGTPNLKQNSIFTFDFIFSQKEMYFIYDLVNSSVVTRLVLNQNGILQRFVWIDRTQGWSLLRTAQTDYCDNYASCGAYSSCNIDNSPVCGCLEGFVPKYPKDWDIADWSNGCVRRTSLNCQSGDGFVKYSGIKLPDTQYSWYNKSMTLEECRFACLNNCTCMAYTSLDISTGGSGCLLWFDNLIDMKELKENGQEIFIRMASSEVGQVGFNRKKRTGIIVSSVLLVGMLLLGLSLTLYVWKKKKRSRHGETEHNPERGNTTEGHKVDPEVPLFDFATVANATNNFSIDNKLGEGGFGPVYMGVLEGGQEIAVKRLSKNSEQGLGEFMNEVSFIAKLQHRNLVKLLGCCIEEQKMLIYEYMSNKSLDFFIFDETQRMLLTWHNRFNIINGIARGLLYLHQDSRLRIIHRDLKAANILLDYDMNPKISDFGMARSFGGNETEANTNRVVGTYGYMPPEYAIDGIFSAKSDVFSFGVLVLEIVSGKKNKGFYHPDHYLNLLGHAWRLYGTCRHLELLDASVGDSYNSIEVLRSIQVGLLCVQQYPEDRPSMSSVVLMLSSESELPQPKEPGFYTERNPIQANSSSSHHESCSANEASFTLLSAR